MACSEVGENTTVRLGVSVAVDESGFVEEGIGVLVGGGVQVGDNMGADLGGKT